MHPCLSTAFSNTNQFQSWLSKAGSVITTNDQNKTSPAAVAFKEYKTDLVDFNLVDHYVYLLTRKGNKGGAKFQIWLVERVGSEMGAGKKKVLYKSFAFSSFVSTSLMVLSELVAFSVGILALPPSEADETMNLWIVQIKLVSILSSLLSQCSFLAPLILLEYLFYLFQCSL